MTRTSRARLGRVAARLIARDPSPPAGVHAADWLAAPRRARLRAAAPPAPLAFSLDEQQAARPRGAAAEPVPGAPSRQRIRARKNWPRIRRPGARARARRSVPGRLRCGRRGRGRARCSRCRTPWPRSAWPARDLGALLDGRAPSCGNDSGVSHLAAAAGAPTLAAVRSDRSRAVAPLGDRVAHAAPREPIGALRRAGRRRAPRLRYGSGADLGPR